MSNLLKWLASIGLAQYADAFTENEITFELLPKLTSEDIRELGITPIGHRRRLLNAIAQIQVSDAGQAETAHAAATPSSGASEAERRRLTVLFCDLVGSTRLANRLDPELMRELLLGYQNAVAGEIARLEGHLAKFVGDGVLAYFGYPKAHEDDAERAVRTALAIVAAVGKLATPDKEALAVRIGIASGLVVVGDMIGSGPAAERSVVGETPNLAARLQSVAAPNQVVIASETRRLIAHVFRLDDLGELELKGFDGKLRAFSVLGEGTSESRFEARQLGGLGPMFGREHELSLLLDRWHMAEAGEGQMVLLVGEAGIGKSRLTRAAIDAIADKTHFLLLYQCSPHHVDSALYPVIQRLIRVAKLAPDDPSDIALDKLEQLLAVGTENVGEAAALIAPLLGIESEQRYGKLDLSSAQQRARTLEVLVAQHIDLSKRRPVLFVFEDAHWIDPTSLELLDLCLDRAAKSSVLMLLTARPTFEHRFGGHPIVTRLSLNRLGRDQVRAIAHGMTHGRSLPSEVVGLIASRTDGMPLFVEELTKTILESGILRAVGSDLVLDRPLTDVAVPATLHDSLMARLDRDPKVKEVAQVAACIGREFQYPLLAVVSKLAEPDLREALKLLVSAELVFARGSAPKASYVFKHALVRDAAYESLLKSQRSRIHADIADWLIANAPDVLVQAPELVAQHYAKSGQREPAIAWWGKAGNRALQQSTNTEAISHFSAAISEIAGLPQAEQARAELPLQIGLGSALSAVRGYSHPATGAAYRHGRDLAAEIGNPYRLMSVLYGLWNYDVVRGRYDGARGTAGEMMELARRHADNSLSVVALSALGTTQSWQGDWTDGSRNLSECIRIYDTEAHAPLKLEISEDPCVQALINNAICLWNLGQEDEAIRSINDGLNLAERFEHVTSNGYALAWSCLLHYMRLDGSGALQAVHMMREKLANQDLPFWSAFGEVFGAWAETVAGSRRDGPSQWEKAMAALKGTGGGTMLPTFLGALAEIHLQYGRLDEAYAAAEEGLSIVAANEEHYSEVELYRLKAQTYLRRDPPVRDLGEQALRAALEVARKQQAKSMELRAAVDLATFYRQMGRGTEADTLLDQACRLFDGLPDTTELVKARSLLKAWRESDSQ